MTSVALQRHSAYEVITVLGALELQREPAVIESSEAFRQKDLR